MAEDIPGEPPLPDGDRDDVIAKIDDLLNRHRPKTPAAEAIPVLTDATQDEQLPIDDGIPVLTDMVSGPGQPASVALGLSRSATISSALILRRMAVALDAERSRLMTQVGDDPAQALMLDRLVAELKRALPAAVRAAITEKAADPSQSEGDGRL
jgi:hypothetical protein